MKRTASLLFAAGLTAGLVGCSAADNAGPNAAAPDAVSADTSAAPSATMTLVSLKVPNMV